MKKIEIVILAACFFAVAYQAKAEWNYEFSYGTAHYKADHNGRWIVEGYPRIEELTDTAMAAGVSYTTQKGFTFHGEYLNLGEVRVHTLAPSDPIYSPNSNNMHPDAELYSLPGRGTVAGALLSVSKPIAQFGPVSVHAEVGPYLFIHRWKADYFRASTGEWLGGCETKAGVKVAPALGLYVRYSKHVDVGVRWMDIRTQGDRMCPGFAQDVYNGYVRLVF